MEAKIKATGEIVHVGDYNTIHHDPMYKNERTGPWRLEELDFEVTDKDDIYNKGWADGWDEAVKSEIPKIHPRVKGSDPDYWTRLEHQYAGMAMQQLVHLVNVGYEYVYEETALIAMNFAHALVEKLKKK